MAEKAEFTVHDNKPRQWTGQEIALVQSITERTWEAVDRAKAEDALRASQKRFESIANLVPDLLWDSAPDGATNWYNQVWLSLTRKNEEAILQVRDNGIGLPADQLLAIFELFV